MAIVVEATDTWTYYGNSTQNESFTCPAGTNVLVVVVTVYRAGSGAQAFDLTPDAVSYNSSALSSAVSNAFPSTNRQRHTQIYYLASPDTGSAYTLTYDPAVQAGQSLVSAIALSGCDTSDLIGATYTADTSSTDIVESITTEQDNSIVIAGVTCGTNSDTTLTEDGSTTEVGYYDWDDFAYDPSNATGYRICGAAGSHDVGWTSSNTNNAAFAAVELQADSGYTLSAAAGTLSLDPQDATFTADYDYSLVAEAGTLNLDPQDAGLNHDISYTLTAEAASLSLDPQNAFFRILVDTPTSRIYTPPAQNRTHTPALQSRTHTPPAQSRTITL